MCAVYGHVLHPHCLCGEVSGGCPKWVRAVYILAGCTQGADRLSARPVCSA